MLSAAGWTPRPSNPWAAVPHQISGNGKEEARKSGDAHSCPIQTFRPLSLCCSTIQLRKKVGTRKKFTVYSSSTRIEIKQDKTDSSNEPSDQTSKTARNLSKPGKSKKNISRGFESEEVRQGFAALSGLKELLDKNSQKASRAPTKDALLQISPTPSRALPARVIPSKDRKTSRAHRTDALASKDVQDGSRLKASRASAGEVSMDQLDQNSHNSSTALAAGLVPETADESKSRIQTNGVVLMQSDPKSQGTAQGRGTTTTLHVSNLAKEVSRADFESIMQQIPEITSFSHLLHKTGVCRDYGFCDVRPGADVEAVIEALSHLTLHGKKLKVAISEAKDNVEESEAVTDQPPECGKLKSSPSPSHNLISAEKSAQETNLKHPKSNPTVHRASRRNPAPISSSTKRVNDTWTPKRLAPPTLTERAEEEDLDPKPSTSSSSIQDPEQKATENQPLTGRQVLEALQQRAASTSRTKAISDQRRRGSGSGRLDMSNNVDDEQNADTLGDPIIVKPEWDVRLRDLEVAIAELKRNSWGPNIRTG